MADLFTPSDARPAPADFLDRTLRFEWLQESSPTDSLGAACGKTTPARLLRGFSGTSWEEIYGAFGDFGFRLHPDASAADFPGIVHLCAPCEDGTYLVATVTEGDLAIVAHETYEAACAWIDVDDDIGSRFAWQRS